MGAITSFVTDVINNMAYLCGRCNGTEDEYIHLSNRNSFVEVAEYNNDFDSGRSTADDTQCCASGVTVVVKAPLAGSTTIQLPQVPPPPARIAKKGNKNEKQNDEKPELISEKTNWVALPSSSVHVRGANYLDDKKKEPSLLTLYELVDVDVVDSQLPLFDISEKYDLSQISQKINRTTHQVHKTWLAPNFLVISFLLPTTAPKIGTRTSQRGYIVTGYFRLRKETKDILQIITNSRYSEAVKANKLNLLSAGENSGSSSDKNYNGYQKDRINAVKLWEKWCKTSPSDPEMQARLKFIFRGDNLRELGVPNWICKYNGKPMMIKRPGITNLVFSHPRDDRLEIDINMHPLPFVFKQAMSHLKEHYFRDTLMTFAFVIEGRSEDELPEVLLGNPLNLPYNPDEIVVKANNIFVDGGLV